jgi:penicillin-binding protein 1A
MGFSFPLVNHPSLALGTAEASIMETAVAYSAFTNGGYKINPQSIVSITSSEGEVIYQNSFSEVRTRVLTERTGLLMSAILRKAVLEGTGATMRSVYGVTAPFAGKTGTSQNYSDAWFAAFNPKVTIVARVGASSPAIHFSSGSYGTGGALALPLVALTLKGIGSDPEAGKQLLASFPKLPPELAAALDCPDFKKDTFFDNFLELFKKKELIYNTDSEKAAKKKKPFFKRLFKR